jgi:hypothetical protein
MTLFGPPSIPELVKSPPLHPASLQICELECNANYVANTDAGVTSTCVNGAWTNAGKCVKGE